MSDSNSPIVPARPSFTKRDSQSTASIPVIPARPRKQTKSPEILKTEDIGEKSTPNTFNVGNEKEEEKIIESSGISGTTKVASAIPVLDKEVSKHTSSDESNSADILSEIVTELAQESSNEEIGEIPISGEKTYGSSAVTATTDVSESTADFLTPVGNTPIDTKNSESIKELHVESSEGFSSGKGENSLEISEPKTAKSLQETAEIEENKNGPKIPTRPKKLEKKVSSKDQLEKIEKPLSDSVKEGDILAKNMETFSSNESVVKDTVKTEKTEKTTPSKTADLNQSNGKDFETETTDEDPKTGSTKENSETTPTLLKYEPKPLKVSRSASSLTEDVQIEEKSSPEKSDIKVQDSGSDVELSSQPIVPKRPTRTPTPKIPTRPVKQNTNPLVDQPVEKTDSDPNSETSAPVKRVPPPKPKKLSSKIAAFQQMFNQAPLEQTLPKSSPTERGKLSSNQTEFGSNLQNMMGRGFALPGMANPEMVKKLSASEKSNDSEPESGTEPTEKATASIPRRARGPRGKRLPKSIQETQIEVQPRFQISVADVWEVKFTKTSSEKVSDMDSKEIEIPESELESADVEEKSEEKKFVEGKKMETVEESESVVNTADDAKPSIPATISDAEHGQPSAKVNDLDSLKHVEKDSAIEGSASEIKHINDSSAPEQGIKKGDLVNHEKEQSNPKIKDLKETGSKESTARETYPENSHPKETSPKETAAKETIPSKSLAKADVPKDSVSETIPKNIVTKDTIPNESVPKESIPKDIISNESPKESSVKDIHAKELNASDTIPKQTAATEKPGAPAVEPELKFSIENTEVLKGTAESPKISKDDLTTPE